MKLNGKLIAIGAVGALGAAAFGVAHAVRRRRQTRDIDARFDTSDLEPVIVSEEVVVVTDATPYDADLDFIQVDPYK